MQPELCARIAQALATAPIHDHLGYEALAFLKLPGPDYRAVLRLLHEALRPKLYVEIGVRDGGSLALALPETRCIGIDPDVLVRPEQPRPNTVLTCTTSDRFFERDECRESARGFDLAFIDGDHSFDQALRDFVNLEKLAKPSSIICIHDVIPMDERTATPQALTSFHTGDVWRLMTALATARTDLTAFTVACPPTGLGIVGRFGHGQPLSQDDIAEAGALAFEPDWDVWRLRLNIVPNGGKAIAEALLGKKAA